MRRTTRRSAHSACALHQVATGPSRRVLIALASAVLVLGAFSAAQPVFAADKDVVYPAKVTTVKGRVYHFESLGHELAEGSFVGYDGETELRIPWRDISKVTFVGNIGHSPSALGPTQRGTVRAREKRSSVGRSNKFCRTLA